MNTDNSQDEFLSVAVELAQQAGRLAVERMTTARSSRKADRTLVTDADLAAQLLVAEGIASQYADHAVLGEETLPDAPSLPDPAQAEFCWVVDPIDGTRNYARGFPCFCVSLALLRRGEPIVGVVYDPLRDSVYRASAGGGAFLGERKLSAADNPARGDILIGVPSGHNRKMPDAIHAWLDRFNLRNVGSTALHLAYVAAGCLDVAYCRECYIWDIAAGWLLVREAGGTITDPAGGELFPATLEHAKEKDTPFLAAGKTIHTELLDEIE